jgi:hypothetical protein
MHDFNITDGGCFSEYLIPYTIFLTSYELLMIFIKLDKFRKWHMPRAVLGVDLATLTATLRHGSDWQAGLAADDPIFSHQRIKNPRRTAPFL